MDAPKTLVAIAFVPAGLLVGWAYFALMRCSLGYLGQKGGTVRFVVLVLLRVLLLAGALFGAVQVSTWCLITFTAGFVVARTIAVARARPDEDSSPVVLDASPTVASGASPAAAPPNGKQNG